MPSVSIETAFYALEAITAICLVGIIAYIWKQSRKTRHQRHVRKVVESLGVKFIRDVVLPDGIDGLVFIDYLLLVPTGFVVLDLRYSAGHLFGGETVDQWSQVINNKTYKFNNPLYSNQSECQAVIWNTQNKIGSAATQSNPQWDTYGWVVFSNEGNFPKGIPAQVSMIDELKDKLGTLLDADKTIDDDLQTAWDGLHNLSLTTRAENTR